MTSSTRRTLLLAVAISCAWTSVLVLSTCSRAEAPGADIRDRVAGKLITFNDNGGWSWFESERVIFDHRHQKILLSSVANAAGAEGAKRNGNIEVVAYDLSNQSLQKFTLSARLEADDHDSAALLVLPDERYLASYSKHSSDNRLRYRLSLKPGDSSTWGSEQAFAAAAGTTYSNLCYLSKSNTVFNFHRDRGNGFDPNYVLWRLDEAGGFKFGGRLFTGPEGNRGSKDRPYVRYVGNGVDRVHFLTTDHHPRNLKSNGLYHGYVQYEGAQKYGVYQTNGKRLGDLSQRGTSPFAASDFTPLLKGDEVSPANQLRMTRGWATDIELDSAGQPSVVFTARANDDDEDHRFFYGRYLDGEWRVHELAKAGGHLYESENDYTGLAAIDPDVPSRVFISSKVDPRDEKIHLHYEIFEGRSSDHGASWRWLPITASSTVDNIRPVVPRGAAGATVLLWMRGQYDTYTKYNTSIVGLTRIETLP